MSNKCNKNCASHEVKLRGPRGFKGDKGDQGPQGPSGATGPGASIDIITEDDLTVESNTVGDQTVFTIGRPKELFHDYISSQLDISVDPAWTSLTYFQPTGYTTLNYTNPSSETKKYKVFGTYQHEIIQSSNKTQVGSWVDAAIVKTGGVIIEQAYGIYSMRSNLFWGTAGNESIGSGTPVHNLIDDQGSVLDLRMQSIQFTPGKTIVQVVTLDPGETVSLMFRTKDATTVGEPPAAWLVSGSLLVEEIGVATPP